MTVDEREWMQPVWTTKAALLGTMALFLSATTAWATEHHGQVRFRGRAVPGATVVATQDGKRVEITSDADGRYSFADLSDGTWKLHVELLGFEPLDNEVQVGVGSAADALELKMLAPDQALALAAPRAFKAPEPPQELAKTLDTPAAKSAEAPHPPEEPSQAADGLLLNGSSSNAATSQFSLDRAFGNQRNGSKALYTGGLALIAGNSAFDARPYSLTGLEQPKASYNKLTEVLTFGGPLNIPKLGNGRMWHGPNFFLVYQRTRNQVQASEPGLVPTVAQRATVTDSVAQALLAYYPQPNLVSSSGYNYQTQVLNDTHEDALQLRMDRALGQRDEVRGTVALDSTRQDSSNLFDFRDTTATLGLNVATTWQHRLNHGMYLDLGYRFSRLRTDVTPFFADRVNVSGDAGLTGRCRMHGTGGRPRSPSRAASQH